MVFYLTWRTFFRIFGKACFRLRVEGLENLPAQGSFILAANHASSLDPFMLIAAIPRYIRWLIVYEYYDLWYLRWVVRRMRFIRLENNLPKEAFRALLRGEIVGLFPEGRRTWDGHLGRAQRGVAALARRVSCPVVPVALEGTFEALPRTRKFLKFHPITVRIGKPLFFSATPINKEDSVKVDQENTQRIMTAIAELLQA